MDEGAHPPAPGGPLLRVSEVARLLRVSSITVYRRIADGELRAVRVGDSPVAPLRVPREAVDELLRPARAPTAA